MLQVNLVDTDAICWIKKTRHIDTQTKNYSEQIKTHKMARMASFSDALTRHSFQFQRDLSILSVTISTSYRFLPISLTYTYILAANVPVHRGVISLVFPRYPKNLDESSYSCHHEKAILCSLVWPKCHLLSCFELSDRQHVELCVKQD